MSPAALEVASGSPAQAPPAVARGDQAVMPNSFVRGSMEMVIPFADNTTQMIPGGPVAVGPLDVPSLGYARHIIMLVEATGGAGGANTVAKHEDSPWRAIQDVTLTDVNGTPIVGVMDGYDLLLANRWGAYAFETDPEQSPSFSDVAVGAGASGNFTFLLRIPIEIAGRDGLGALPNLSSATAYKLSYSVAPSTRVYTTVPATTLPSVRVRCWLEAWAQPPPQDIRGVPNVRVPAAVGTTQYWARGQFVVNAGDQRIALKRVGNLIRTLVLYYRTNAAGNPRSTNDIPDPVRLELDNQIVANIGRPILRHYMRERFTQPLDAYDTGVIAIDFTHDLDYKPGDEMRDLYLVTTQASKIELVGNFGTAGTLTVLTNDVAPGGDIYAEAS